MKKETPFKRWRYDSLHVSVLAEQQYCEKRVDLWLENPTTSRISLPPDLDEEELRPEIIQKCADLEESVGLGREFHDAVEQSTPPISRIEAEKRMKLGESLTVQEFSLRGYYGKVPIMGKADAIHFEGDEASCLIEYKKTHTKALTPSHHLQLRLYGYLLEQEGFDVKDLVLACCFVPTRLKAQFEGFNQTQKGKLLQAIIKVANRFRPSSSKKKQWWESIKGPQNSVLRLGILKYDPNKVRNELNFLIRYWLGKRAAVPVKAYPEKCATCLYNGASRCSEALVPFRGR